MAEKNYTFRINTEGDPSGAKEVEQALDGATDAMDRFDDASQSIDSFTSGGTTSIAVDFRKAEEAIDKTGDAVREVEKDLDQATDAARRTTDALDTSEAVPAINRTTEAVEDLGKEIDEVAAKPPPIKPSDVAPAEGSIAALRAELNRVQQELEQVAVGSAAFDRLAARAVSLQREIGEAESKIRQLGGTMGRGGNGGLAVLEFSRLLEDAQYGIRGVLNNIPSLITMLGLGSGLAGVISILAVVAATVWDQMSKGAKESTQDVGKLKEELEAATKFYEELGKAALDDIRTRGRVSEQRMEFLEKEAAMEERIASARDSLGGLQARRNGEISLMEERLRLAKEEAKIALSGGEVAKATLKAREESQKRVLEIERQVTEEIRKRELAPLQRAVEKAQAEKDTAAVSRDRSRSDVSDIEQERQQLADDLNASQNARLQQIQAATAELNQAKEELARRQAMGTDGFDDSGPSADTLSDRIEELSKAILELRKIPDRETQIQGQLNGTRGQIEEARANADQATERWVSAADAVTEAARRLQEAQERQNFDRDADARKQAVGDQQATFDRVKAKLDLAGEQSAEKLSGTLAGILEAIGNAAEQPAVKDRVSRLEALLKNGLQANEEDQVSRLFMELISSVRSSDTRRSNLLAQVIQAVAEGAQNDRNLQAELRDVRADLSRVQSNMGNPNP